MVGKLIKKLLSHCELNHKTGCIEWQRSRVHTGYGQMSVEGKQYRTHRISAFLFLGLKSLSSKKDVLHKCDNPPCINPDHLYIGTARDNVKDMMLRKRNKPKYGVYGYLRNENV